MSEGTTKEQGAIYVALDRLENSLSHLEGAISRLGNRIEGVSRSVRPTVTAEGKIDHPGESDICNRIKGVAENLEGLNDRVNGHMDDMEL